MEQAWWFGGWTPVARSVVVGLAAYASLVVVLRVSGKRTLSKMNAFDLVVTVALGSSLSAILIDDGTSLAQGGAAFVTLIALQAGVAWACSRSAAVNRLITAKPTLLAYDGRLLVDALRRERCTEDDVQAALRASGIGSLDEVGAVVLEGDGSMTVLPRSASPAGVMAGLR